MTGSRTWSWTARKRLARAFAAAGLIALTGGAATTLAYSYPVGYPSQLNASNWDAECIRNNTTDTLSVTGFGPTVWAADKNPAVRNSQFVEVRPILQRSTGSKWSSVQLGEYKTLRTYDDLGTKFPNVTFDVSWTQSINYYRVAWQVYWLSSPNVAEFATTLYPYSYLWMETIPGLLPLEEPWESVCPL